MSEQVNRAAQLQHDLDELHQLRGHGVFRSRLFRIFAYPAFLFHLLIFGLVGFVFAYSDANPSAIFLYGYGLIAVLCFVPLYRSMFGADEMKWMLINSGLGIFGIYSEVDWLISSMDHGRTLDSYPLWVHPVPFLYYIMYTFLLRQMVLDITGAREPGMRKKIVEYSYVILSLLVHLAFYLTK